MKTKNTLVFALAVLLFLSCGKSKEEKANELIRAELFRTLFDFESYEPIETIVDSVFTCIYSDSAIRSLAITVIAANNLFDEEMDKVRDAQRTMDIWSDSWSESGRRRYNEARRKALESLSSAEIYLEMIKITYLSMKEEIEKHEPSFIGFQAKHRFRTRTRGGNFTIGDYIFIIDPKFQEILSVRDLDDEDERRIRRIISEARTIQFQE